MQLCNDKLLVLQSKLGQKLGPHQLCWLQVLAHSALCSAEYGTHNNLSCLQQEVVSKNLKGMQTPNLLQGEGGLHAAELKIEVVWNRPASNGIQVILAS